VAHPGAAKGEHRRNIIDFNEHICVTKDTECSFWRSLLSSPVVLSFFLLFVICFCLVLVLFAVCRAA
jgi:hypothetical protein